MGCGGGRLRPGTVCEFGDGVVCEARVALGSDPATSSTTSPRSGAAATATAIAGTFSGETPEEVSPHRSQRQRDADAGSCADSESSSHASRCSDNIPCALELKELGDCSPTFAASQLRTPAEQLLSRGDSRTSTQHSAVSSSSTAPDHNNTLEKTILHSGTFARRLLRVRAMQAPESLKKAATTTPMPDMAMPVFDAKMDPTNLLDELPATACKSEDFMLERITFMGTEWLGLRCARGSREQCMRFCVCASALSNVGKSCSRSVVVEVVSEDQSPDFIPAIACAPISSARRGGMVSITWLDYAEAIDELCQILTGEAPPKAKLSRLHGWSQRDWPVQPTSCYQLNTRCPSASSGSERSRRPSVGSLNSGRSGRSARSPREARGHSPSNMSDPPKSPPGAGEGEGPKSPTRAQSWKRMLKSWTHALTVQEEDEHPAAPAAISKKLFEQPPPEALAYMNSRRRRNSAPALGHEGMAKERDGASAGSQFTAGRGEHGRPLRRRSFCAASLTTMPILPEEELARGLQAIEGPRVVQRAGSK